MDLIDGIASLSTALSTAQLQSAVAARVFQIARGQSQVAADLIDAAVETVTECIQQFADDAGSNLDVIA